VTKLLDVDWKIWWPRRTSRSGGDAGILITRILVSYPAVIVGQEHPTGISGSERK
jgi:hypothetical protein